MPGADGQYNELDLLPEKLLVDTLSNVESPSLQSNQTTSKRCFLLTVRNVPIRVDILYEIISLTTSVVGERSLSKNSGTTISLLALRSTCGQLRIESRSLALLGIGGHKTLRSVKRCWSSWKSKDRI